MADVNRWSSRRWSWRTSRWRERLFCLRAEDVRVASESSNRESWEMRVSRCMKRQRTIRMLTYLVGRRTRSRRSFNCDCVRSSSSVGSCGGFVSEANWAYVWKRVSVYSKPRVSHGLGTDGASRRYLCLERAGLLPQLCPSGAGGRHGRQVVQSDKNAKATAVSTCVLGSIRPRDIPKTRAAERRRCAAS